jgi:hypothetical protein
VSGRFAEIRRKPVSLAKPFPVCILGGFSRSPGRSIHAQIRDEPPV